jgi:hypothetical protein
LGGEGAQPSRKLNYHSNEETRKIILKYRNKLPSFIINTGIYTKIPRVASNVKIFVR